MPPVPGVEHRDVAVNGVRLHVAEAGVGPPLILLHGWPQHWWCWRRLMLRLAEDYRVLAPDLRGWGWSEAPRDNYAKDTFAADILTLMAAEGLTASASWDTTGAGTRRFCSRWSIRSGSSA